MSLSEFVTGAVDAGIDAATAGALADVFSQVLDGRNAYTTDDVERVLHRPAHDFRDYALATAAAGTWAASMKRAG